MAALVDGGGRLIAANRALLPARWGEPTRWRAAARSPICSPPAPTISSASPPRARTADPLRLVQLPLDESDPGAATVFLLFDEDGRRRDPARRAQHRHRHVHALLAMLPLGLALAERDGRILFMNEAFERAAAIPPGQSVMYPGDLVVKEDKGAVSDAVRRFSAGRAVSGDLAVRLAAGRTSRWRSRSPAPRGWAMRRCC